MTNRDLHGVGGRWPDLAWPGGARLAVSIVVNFEEGAELQVGDGEIDFKRLGDILEKGCDMVVMYIGVNDVWHKFTHNTGTDVETFEQVYSAIVERIKSAYIKLILCTPAVIGEKIQQTNIADIELEKVCAIIRKIASDYDLPLVDLRKTFTQYLLEKNIENMESGILTSDGVHLNEKGNQMVANEIWTTI